MHELASVHQHENGFSVTLRKPKSKDSKKYEYDAGTSHVAEDEHKAAALVHAHLGKVAKELKPADKADKLGDAVRKSYRQLVGKDTEDKSTTESGNNADKHDGDYFPN